MFEDGSRCGNLRIVEAKFTSRLQCMPANALRMGSLRERCLSTGREWRWRDVEIRHSQDVECCGGCR